jgi:hypothetical protein
MRPQRVVLGSATTKVVPVDFQQQDFKLGLQMEFTDTATASAEATMDDVQDSDITPVWFAITDLDGITADAQGNVFFPIRAVRLNVTAWTSGDVILTILQANAPG